MKGRRQSCGVAVLGAAVLLGGCAGASASTTVEIVALYSRFEPSDVTVAAGRPIHFVLRNEDPIDHEWIVGDEAVHAAHRDGTEPAHGERPTEQSLPALSSIRTTVTFDQPGRHRFVCHLPGHEAYGMTGTIVVTEG